VLPRALPSGHHRTYTCPSSESGRISKWLPSPASESYSNSIRIKSNHYHGHSSLPVKYRKRSTKLLVRVSYSDRIQLKSSFRISFYFSTGHLISNAGPKKNRNIECHRPSGQLTPIELRRASFSRWLLSITSQSGNYKHEMLRILRFRLNGICTSGQINILKLIA